MGRQNIPGFRIISLPNHPKPDSFEIGELLRLPCAASGFFSCPGENAGLLRPLSGEEAQFYRVDRHTFGKIVKSARS
jgi:hypothetical protein